MTENVRLAAGDPAPDFTLPTDTGDTLALKDLHGRKVVLYAYPAAMTPGRPPATR
jgi:thioredoxin-dependent peroxiredoxin